MRTYTQETIHPTGVKLEPPLKDKLKKLGKIKHRTVHWLMKEAIRRYIEQEEQYETLKQETLVRWQEAEQSKVVSNEAMTTWLDTWGTDKETGRPPCES